MGSVASSRMPFGFMTAFFDGFVDAIITEFREELHQLAQTQYREADPESNRASDI
ncbi:hypothetical protein DPMN_175021 [Dreissena polymorpha]|uniref:Uncharacterized protein n=1 Tax=Dreissena polymorpha TaxID=45954 RepID=A0A9D4E6F8_DREPO|nr:hypothetical protein DPMN_175021 [Dreissena polymorpha]